MDEWGSGDKVVDVKLLKQVLEELPVGSQLQGMGVSHASDKDRRSHGSVHVDLGRVVLR